MHMYIHAYIFIYIFTYIQSLVRSGVFTCPTTTLLGRFEMRAVCSRWSFPAAFLLACPFMQDHFILTLSFVAKHNQPHSYIHEKITN